MTTQEEGIKNEMRISALEHFVCKIAVVSYQALRLTTEQIEEALDKYGEGSGMQMFPGFDPGASDLLNAEWHAAVLRLVQMQKALLARQKS